jgi:hypothetical protein
MKLIMENWRSYVEEVEQDEELLEEGVWGFLKGGVLGTVFGAAKGAGAGAGLGAVAGGVAGGPAGFGTGTVAGAAAGGALGGAIGGIKGAYKGAFEDGEANRITVEPEEETDFTGFVLDILGVVGDLPPIAAATGGISVVVSSSADLLNAARYIKRGQYFFALLSLISAIPAVGDALGKGVKYFGKGAGKAMQAAKATGMSADAARAAPEVTKAIDRAKKAKQVEVAFAKRFGPNGALQANKFFKFVADNNKHIEMLAKMVLKDEVGRRGAGTTKKDLAKLAKSTEFKEFLQSAIAAGKQA